MREMKDSGIPWIGLIPHNWDVRRIRHALKWTSIRGKGDSQVLSLYREYGVVPKDSRDDNHNVTSEKTEDYKYVEVGNFVINKMKAWQGSMAVSGFAGIVSPAYYVCAFIDDNIHKRYFHYLLRNVSYLPEYRRLSTGLRIGQWDLGFEDFRNIPFLLPPLFEQKVIAEFLDKKCAEIDELVGIEEHIIAELQAYKQAIITEAVTKGIDENEKQNKQSFTTISNICYLSDGIKIEGRRLINLDVQYLRGKSKGTIISSGKYIPAYSLLILVDGENSGEVFSTPIEGYQGSTFKKLTINKNWYEKYVIYIINSLRVKLKENKVGSAIPHLDKKLFNKTKVNIIPLPEQQAIAEYLDKRCDEIDSLIEVKQQKIVELKEYKKSVIYEYVTGKKEII